MTMHMKVVNAGNRSSDQIRVYHATTGELLLTIKRGDVMDLTRHLGVPLRFEAVYDHDDEWVGEPHILVADPPKGATT